MQYWQLLLLLILSFCASCVERKDAQLETVDPAQILFVCSSVDSVNGNKNGTFLSEIAVPFILLAEKGYEIDIVSPQGGRIPIYYKFDTTSLIRRALDSPYYQQKTAQSLAPDQVMPHAYDAVILPGGYGQFWDIHQDERIHKIISQIYEQEGILGALGHGTSSLVPIKLSSGEFLVKGKTMTCFPSWFEKEVMFEANYGELLPFDMEEEFEQRGANLKKVDKETRSNGEIVDVENRIITASSATGGAFIAKEVIRLLEEK